jgi:hypothetical protein
MTSSSPATLNSRDEQGDFDFEIGAWQAHVSRLAQPLSATDKWVEYRGTSVVRPIWAGRANFGELDVEGPDGRIEGLSLRLFHPQSAEWHIYWANSRDGGLGQPMIGRFDGRRGEFYNQELFDGRAVFVRFLFSGISSNAFQLEQAFSVDGGASWEPNWIAEFSRLRSTR